ncbi:MAG: flagellar basal body P-ring formation chaperone FlgA [Synergistaceae bacterium]|jgi:flagella basal body P-ring formation protein FlgA|nr:flagellar basal body P-ring formation chaperone FlgA [Synergistaceae bacterium]
MWWKTGRRLLRLFFAFLLFSSPGVVDGRVAAAAEALRVTVPRVVQVEGEACALSDIAVLDGPSALTGRVGALLLSVQDGVITRQQVIDALKVSGLEGVRIELKMPAAVTVIVTNDAGEPAALPANAQMTEEALSSAVKALAAWDGDVEVRHQGPIPPGNLVSPGSIVPGTASATLKFQDASGRQRSLATRLFWHQSVLVLARSVKKDEPLRETDFVVRRIRVSRPGLYASRLDEVLGRSLRKALSQGEPVPLNLIAGVPIIERGKSVVIVVKDGSLTVRAKGEALENGAMGETIKVRNLASRAVLSAIVVGKDTVEVKVP